MACSNCEMNVATTHDSIANTMKRYPDPNDDKTEADGESRANKHTVAKDDSTRSVTKYMRCGCKTTRVMRSLGERLDVAQR